MTDEQKQWTCVLCGKACTGYGNNAEPLAEGRCCDACNNSKVISARLAQLRRFSLINPLHPIIPY